jgi:drug/metabolite transporter (DMT)-like permease
VVPTREEEEASYDVFFGDVLTLIGSVAWAFFTFRLSRLAPNVNPLKLAVARSFCMACFVGVWFLVERALSWSAVKDGGAVDDDGLGRLHKTHGSWLASPRALALTAFMAIGPGWLCGWWQTVAQASVPAARAAVLLATTPLWGAAWAAATMGERMATVGWVGGLTVVGGTMLVALER